MIYLGADHRGYELKEAIKGACLEEFGRDFVDCGAYDYDANDDFVDYGSRVARSVKESEKGRGVLFCGSGQGMCMAANRYAGVRASLAYSAAAVEEAVKHDRANVMCVPADDYGADEACELIAAFLETEPLEEEKYRRRVRKLDELE